VWKVRKVQRKNSVQIYIQESNPGSPGTEPGSESREFRKFTMCRLTLRLQMYSYCSCVVCSCLNAYDARKEYAIFERIEMNQVYIVI